MTADNHDPFALARSEADADADLFALIAEEDRLRTIGVHYRGRADDAMFALSKEEQQRLREQYPEEEDLPEPAGSLYAEAGRYNDAADEVFYRVANTKPVTLAGVLAMADLCPDAIEVHPYLGIAIEGLRDIVEREPQS